MRLAVRLLSLFCLTALLSAAVTADEPKAEKKEEPKKDPYAQIFSFPKEVKLTAEQEEKVAALRKEYTGKLDEVGARIAKVITPERQKVVNATRKEATGAGKKGKEVQEAILAALKLTDDEAAAYKAATQDRAKVVKEINEKKAELLTDEQKALIKKPKTDK